MGQTQRFSQSTSVTPPPHVFICVFGAASLGMQQGDHSPKEHARDILYCHAQQRTSSDFHHIVRVFLICGRTSEIISPKRTAVPLCWSLFKLRTVNLQRRTQTRLNLPVLPWQLQKIEEKNTVGIQLILNKMVI